MASAPKQQYQDIRYWLWRKQQLARYRNEASQRVRDRVTILFQDTILCRNKDHRVLIREVFKDCKRPVERAMRKLTGLEDWTMQETFFIKALQSRKSTLHYAFCGPVMWVEEAIPKPTMVCKEPRSLRSVRRQKTSHIRG